MLTKRENLDVPHADKLYGNSQQWQEGVKCKTVFKSSDSI